MNQSREAHHSAWPHHSPEGGQSAAVLRPTGPTRGHDQHDPAPGRWGTQVGGVGASVPISVGVDGLGHGGTRPGPGRAVELASEAARAEGASSPSPPTVAGGRRGGRVPVKRDRGRQPSSPAVPSRLTLGHRCRSCTLVLGRSNWPVSPGGRLLVQAADSAGSPGDPLLVGDAVGQAAIQDPDQPIAQGPERLMMGLAAGPVGVIAASRPGEATTKRMCAPHGQRRRLERSAWPTFRMCRDAWRRDGCRSLLELRRLSGL